MEPNTACSLEVEADAEVFLLRRGPGEETSSRPSESTMDCANPEGSVGLLSRGTTSSWDREGGVDVRVGGAAAAAGGVAREVAREAG